MSYQHYNSGYKQCLWFLRIKSTVYYNLKYCSFEFKFVYRHFIIFLCKSFFQFLNFTYSEITEYKYINLLFLNISQNLTTTIECLTLRHVQVGTLYYCSQKTIIGKNTNSINKNNTIGTNKTSKNQPKLVYLLKFTFIKVTKN